MSTSRASSKSNVGAGANRSDSGTVRTDRTAATATNSGALSMSEAGPDTNGGASSMSSAGIGAIIGSVMGGGITGGLLKDEHSLHIAKGIGVGSVAGASFGTGVGTLADKFTRHKKPLNATKRGAIAGALAVAAPMAVVGVLAAGETHPKDLAGGLAVTGVVTGLAAGIGAGAGASIDKFTRYKRDQNKTRGTPQPN